MRGSMGRKTVKAKEKNYNLLKKWEMISLVLGKFIVEIN